MDAKELRNAIAKMYSRNEYYQFCEYMGFNPKYDYKYWDEFIKLVSAISTFDNASLQKILDFGKETEAEK